MNYYLKTREWKHIFYYLKTRRDIRHGNEIKLRRFIEGIWYVCRSGCQWRLLPSFYGSWRAVHQRFRAWILKGVWQGLFQRSQHDPDFEVLMIDTTIVRAHACAAGYGKNTQAHQGLGRSRGGFTTKIHALVDGLGNPLKFILTPGHHHDITQASSLTVDHDSTYLLADKGYNAQPFIQTQKRQCVIPSRKHAQQPREYDKHIYKERHLIECFFGKIKHYRRIFSRFDKTAEAFLAFLYFVSTLIWIK